MKRFSEQLLADVRKFKEVTSLSDWDDEGAPSISFFRWDTAQDLALMVGSGTGLWPNIGPCGDGSIHLDWWLDSGWRLKVECCSNHFDWCLLSLTPHQHCVYGVFRSLEEIGRFSQMLIQSTQRMSQELLQGAVERAHDAHVADQKLPTQGRKP